jgi:hypothetical protein
MKGITEKFFAEKGDFSQEDIERALQLLNKEKEYKAKVARGEVKIKKWADYTPAEKEAANAAAKRYSMKQKLMIAKAKELGIEVTEAEIDAEMAKVVKK